VPISPTFVPGTLDFTQTCAISEPFQDFGQQFLGGDHSRQVDVGYPTNLVPREYFTRVTLSIPVTGETPIPAISSPYWAHPLLSVLWTADVSATTDQYGTPASAGPIGSLGLVDKYAGKRLGWQWHLTFGDGSTWSRTLGWAGPNPVAWIDGGDHITVSQGISAPLITDPLIAWIIANEGSTANYSGTLTLDFDIDTKFRPQWIRWGHDGALLYADDGTYVFNGKTFQRTECHSQFIWNPYPSEGPDPYIDYPLDGFLYTVDLAYLISTVDTCIAWAWGSCGEVIVPPSDDSDAIARDSFNDIVATAWFGTAAAGVKPLYVSILRAAQKNMGSGSGSSAGEDTYTYSASIDERSGVSLVFLPNGDLAMYFDQYSGGVHTEVVVVNKQFGIGPAGNWSAPAAVTPKTSARWKSTGRGQQQGYRFRIGE
jgi:hypothetical protein